MYERSVLDHALMLEKENESLRQRLGEYGFFGFWNQMSSRPRAYEIRAQVKKELTVDEWELVNKFSIDNSEDDIDKVINIIQRLKEKGIFKIPDKYPNSGYEYSNSGYSYPYRVSLAPNGYNPIPNENINDIKEPENPKEPETIINDIFKVVDASEKTNNEYTGEIIEIFAPKKYGDKLHDIFKGNDDYADNNIIINVHDTENAILTICKDNIKDMTQLKLKMSEVLGLLFNKEEPEKVEVEIVE